MGKLFPASLLRRAVAAGIAASGTVAKSAPDPGDPSADLVRQAARAALEAGVTDPAALEQVIRDVFADAYAAGAHAGGVQLPGGGAAVTPAGISSVDWNAWEPGNARAADLAANGGLARMLDSAGVTVQGITGTTLDRLGNLISDGVAAGSNVDTIAASLSGVIDDPSRAEMIAHTEAARAVAAGTFDTYEQNGVGQWDWILSDGACDECIEYADLGPYDVGSGPELPGHPRCRCAPAPVEDSIVAPTDDGSGDFGDVGSVLDEEAGALDDGADVADAGLEGDAAASGADEAAGAADGDLGALTDEALSGALNDAAAAGDEAAMDRVLAELDKRDEAARAAQKAEAAAAKRQAKADADYAARDADYEARIARGEDPATAYADAFGQDVNAMKVKDAIASAKANGYTGRNLEECAQSMLKDWAEQAWLQAEADTNGYLLNAAGRAAGIDPESLFLGTDTRARKYASDELLSWWQQNGRMTVDDFQTSMLGGKCRNLGTAYYA